MPDPDVERLVEKLTSSQLKILKTVEGIDLNTIIYENSAWRTRDILWHIAAWDHQVTKSILAFNENHEYSIHDFDEDGFNQTAYIEGIKLDESHLLDEFNQARQEFKDAVQNFPVDKLSSDFLYPWGDERGNITKLVNYMIDHDEEHRAEIVSGITPD